MKSEHRITDPLRNVCVRRTVRRAAARSRWLGCEWLESRTLLALTPQLLLDINLGAPSDFPYGPPMALAGELFLPGSRLMKTDGTAQGTVAVQDAAITDRLFGIHELTAFNGMLYFAATNNAGGSELWRTDGTSAGTVLVKDIYPGRFGGLPGQPLSGSPNNSEPSQFVNVNGTLFFRARNGSQGFELWKSDGTTAGTSLVKDIYTGTNSSSFPTWLTDVNGKLYFVASDGTAGNELWMSDGTSAGTVRVKDIAAGAASSSPQYLTNVNGTLFFSASDGVSGAELWTSDGTEAGTVLVKDIAPGGGGSSPASLTNLNGALIFRASDGASGAELWKSNGLAGGTVLVKDIVAGPAGSQPRDLTISSGTLFFQAADSATGYALWKTDGTEAGTALVKSVGPGANAAQIAALPRLASVNGQLWLSVNDGSHGYELWKSDGTAAGTVLVKDLVAGPAGSSPKYFAAFGTKTAFLAVKNLQETALWQTDGTADGTAPIAGGVTYDGSSRPSNFAPVGSTLFFAATDSIHGRELWKTDGTAAGTVLVKDIAAGKAGSMPGSRNAFVNIGGTLLFAADSDGVGGQELWKSNGTATGTVLVKDFAEPNSQASIDFLTNVNGRLMFQVNLSGTSGGDLLYKSDGTTTGTVVVKDFRPTGDSIHFYQSFANVSGTLYFSATANGSLLDQRAWKSDGTTAGTIPLAAVSPDLSLGNSASPQRFTNVNGTVFFPGSDNVSRELGLWKTNGTSGGTVLVKQIFDGPFDSSMASLTNINGTLFFVAEDTDGYQLWRSNGTEAGTQKVKNIVATSFLGARPEYLVNLNGTLFFFADSASPTDRAGLWKSDGTEAGTVEVKRFDTPGASPSDLVVIDGVLYFTALDVEAGREIWRSDGTTAGTTILRDSLPGKDAANASYLQSVQGRLIFTGSDQLYGRELWSLVDLNLAPTFVAGPPQSTTDHSGPQSITGWATGISAGAPDEATQQLAFRVTGSSPDLFSVVPELDATGRLSYAPKPNVKGTSTVTVELVDNGGTANGGSNVSSPQTFTITIDKPHRWHNTTVLAAPLVGSLDVDGNGNISPFDAVLVINYLNSGQPSAVPANAPIGGPGGIGPDKTSFLDTGGGADGKGNNVIAPFDAVLVINWLNANPVVVSSINTTSEATGEGENSQTAPAALSSSGISSELADLIALLALDTATQLKRRRF